MEGNAVREAGAAYVVCFFFLKQKTTSDMPRAVSNSSTLIHLALIGQLQLLREFYTQVLVPPAVWKEVVEEGKGRAGAREVEEAAQLGWIKVIAPVNERLLRLLKRDLDEG